MFRSSWDHRGDTLTKAWPAAAIAFKPWSSGVAVNVANLANLANVVPFWASHVTQHPSTVRLLAGHCGLGRNAKLKCRDLEAVRKVAEILSGPLTELLLFVL